MAFLRDVRVRPSTRRYDCWPVWRTLLYTNPLFISVFGRRERAWAGWYGRGAPR